jgi:type III pantothenate kinase
MLLAIDIGNTNIHNGIFKDGQIKKRFHLPTYSGDLSCKYRSFLKPYLKDLEAVIITSVVPKALVKVEPVVRQLLKGEVIVVGRDIDSGIKNLYKKPDKVGQDRLVNARAAFQEYSNDAIVVDFGTAITIEVVSKKKEYLGGVIVPGVELSLWALAEKTALLPKVKIRQPKGIIGRDTEESILIGLVYGYGFLCDGIVNMFKRKYFPKAKVIATGGLSPLISHYCKSIDKVDPDLTLKGLWYIYMGDDTITETEKSNKVTM